ncbi:hypothetical protein ACE1SV_71170 [Streptomyces sennicomposti]
MAESRCPPGGGGAGGEGLPLARRTHHQGPPERRRPLSLVITPGQRADRTHFAARYDERGYTHLGTVTAAALVIWLRT